MNLKTKYLKEAVPAMKEKFGYKNDMAVPKIKKVTINIGLNRAIMEKDQKFVDLTTDTILRITGQQPVKTLSQKSIAGFKIRQGLVVGLKVTLRGTKMYDFLEKLIRISFPRTRDFRGISMNNVDKQGNLSIGLKEQIVFPEISPESITKVHGLEIIITTSAKEKEKGIELFKLIGFPFKKS
ncbi:MAG: 50S ribosomal protein L5 [Patescibacteria group bacterium]|jgi:large subunit ribosomal protein L5|nr:50S ribosomal protein L5 [Patescibacteria group bacterium]